MDDGKPLKWLSPAGSPHRHGWSTADAWSSIVSFLALLTTGLVVHFVLPGQNYPILYAVPVLVAAIRAPPRVVGIVFLLAATFDLIDVQLSPTSDRAWLIAFIALLVVGGVAVRFAIQRTQITRLEQEAHGRVRQTESRLAALVESSDDAIFSTTTDGTILTWNHGCERTFGYPASVAIGANVALTVPPDRLEALNRSLAQLACGDRIDAVDTVRVRGDGRRIDVSVRVSPMHDAAGQVTGVSFISRDITSQKRVERGQRLLADAGSVLASSLDHETALQRVARLVVTDHADWCTIYLVEDEKTIRPIAVAASTPERELILQELARHFERKPIPPPSHALGQALRSGLSQVLSDVTSSVLEDNAADPTALGMVRELGYGSALIVPLCARGRTLGAIVFSVARSTKLTASLDRDLAEELARRAAFEVDNARLYRDAQRAIQVRDEFLAVAAHELKTPITSLRGFAQLELYRLQREARVNPDHLRRTLQVIDVQSQKLSALVSRLLDVIRIDAGRFELTPRPTDLTGLVVQVAAAVQSTLGRHTIRVRTDPLVVAFVDPVRLEQLIANLLDNAARFSPRGGTIELAIDRAAGDVARISIRDHGIGIPQDRRAHIFDLYYQADSENHRSGMGLGLYISRQIAELHGGSIAAEFPEDGGTRVVVTLPLYRNETPAAQRLDSRETADV